MRRKRNEHTPIGILAAAVVVLTAAFLVLRFAVSPAKAKDIPTENSVSLSEKTEEPESTESESLSAVSSESILSEPDIKKVSFSAVGDNLIHGSIYLQGRARAAGNGKDYDFAYLYEGMRPFLAKYDVNYINQETLLTDEIAPATYPCFATPGEIGRAAYDAGWRIFSTSNNHIYDQGAEGIASTLRFWASMPGDVTVFGLYEGAEDYGNITLREENGITFAYLAYTEFTNGLPTPADAPANIIYTSEEDVIQQQITLARQQADVVVVAAHWGVEDSHEVTEGQKALARKMGGWGADVILGSHTHVIQTLEVFPNDDGRETLCIYSLGNFVSAQSRPDEMIGSALTFDIAKDAAGKITLDQIKVHPLITDYGSNYSDIRVLPLYSYTAEQALAHGIRAEYPSFNYEYIKQVVTDIIPEQYLDWED